MTKQQRQELFEKRLIASQKSVEQVAASFRYRGYQTKIPTFTISKDHKDWKNHSDHGDLLVWKGIDSPENKKRIEVKHLTAEFTDRSNWPFGLNFIVCSKHSFETAKELNELPWLYIYMAKDMIHSACVDVADHKHWHVEEKYDKTMARKRQFWMSPIDKVKFFRLPGIANP